MATASPDYPLNKARRNFVGKLVLGAAGARLAIPANTAAVYPRPRDHAAPGLATTKLRQIDAGVLNIGYAEIGPSDGAPVILLHGWPYDIHSFADSAEILAAAGHRVIIPYARGFGTTCFRSPTTFRTAQQAAAAVDVIALMSALGIHTAVLAGFDWGARTANIIAALWPERCTAMVAVNGYLINNLRRNQLPLRPRAEWGWWYQYYFLTERGRAGYAAHRREFNRLIWSNNSPTWAFDIATFARTAAAFDNPDHVDIVVHNYRWRMCLAAGDPAYDALEQRLAYGPAIGVKSITLDGDADGVVPATDGSANAAKFTAWRQHRIIRGAGHNLPQEAPRAFAAAVLDAARV